MTYLLDTNACIQLLNYRDSPMDSKLSTIGPETVAVCQIVKAELYYGAHKSTRREANLALLAQFLSQFQSLPFDDTAAETYGRIRVRLQRKGP